MDYPSIDYSRIRVTFNTRQHPIYQSSNLAVYRLNANWFALVRLAGNHAVSWATGTGDDVRRYDAELSDWTPTDAPIGGGSESALIDWPDFLDAADAHADVCDDCGGNGVIGGRMTLTADGPNDDSQLCPKCNPICPICQLPSEELDAELDGQAMCYECQITNARSAAATCAMANTASSATWTGSRTNTMNNQRLIVAKSGMQFKAFRLFRLPRFFRHPRRAWLLYEPLTDVIADERFTITGIIAVKLLTETASVN